MQERDQLAPRQEADLNDNTSVPLASHFLANGFLGLIFGLDVDNVVTYVSPLMEKVLGRPASDIVGMSFLDLMPEEEARQMESALSSCISGSSDYQPIVGKFIASSGEILPFEVVLMPIRVQESTAGVCVFSSVSSPPPPSKVEIISSSELIDEALDMLPFVVLAMDGNGTVVLFNRAAETATGYSKEEVLGENAALFMNGGSPAVESFTRILKLAIDRRVTTAVIPIRNKEGDRFSLSFKTRFLYDANGNFTAVLGLAHDPRDWSRLEAEAIKLDRNLELLAESSADIVGTLHPAETIDLELGRLIQSLSLDFGIIRLQGPENKPFMFCSGVDFRKGRALLECELREGVPLYKSAESNTPFAFENLDTIREKIPEVGEITTLLCLPIKSRQEVLGCAIFATSELNRNISPLLPILQLFCNQVATSFGNARLSVELLKRNEMLQSLYQTSQAVSGTLDFMEVIRLILQKAKELVNAENCYLFELDKETDKLHCISNISRYSQFVVGYELNFGEGISGIVAQTGQGMLVEHAESDDRSKLVEGTPDEPSSLISVPLKIGEEFVGVVTLEKTTGVPFTKSEYQLIEMFSTQAAMAIRNANIFKKQREYASTLQMYNVLLTHDVANFNVPIHGFLEMLMTDPKLDEKARHYVRIALTQSENISNLISDVRNLSRLKSWEEKVTFEPIDIIPLINDTVKVMRSSHVYGEVELNFQPTESSAYVYADPFVKDVFHNVIGNACKYGGGRVEVTVQPFVNDASDYWRIDVKDAGKGIPEERKPILFKRFDQLDSTTGLEGHGLGLSVVSALCERYRGNIWVEDRVPGDHTKGSVFSVVLPKANKV
jgi:PAS domain S-box-containing protein